MDERDMEQTEVTEATSGEKEPVLRYEVDTVVDGAEETILIDLPVEDVAINVSERGDLWISDDKHSGPSTSRQAVLIVPCGHWTALRRTDCKFE